MEKQPKQLTIQLNTKRDKAYERVWNLEPLPTVVEKALAVLAPNRQPKFNDRQWPTASWLAGMALRAVSEAVIRDGQLPVPFRVDLGEHRYNHIPDNADAPVAPVAPPKQRANEPVETETLEIDVPEIFLKLASDYYNLDPKRLAAALIYDFCCNPPKDLILVRNSADEEGDGDEELPPNRRERF